MYKVRVLQEINDRLDAEYYNPAALSTLKKMETKGTVTTFGDLVDEGYRVVYHGADSIYGLKDSETLPFLSPTQIDANGSISFEEAEKLPLYYKDKYPKGLGKAGEVLVEVKGNVSKVGIIPSTFPKNLMISGSLYKATLDPKRVDSHYVLAFLKSKHGQILKNRLTSNTIINYIAKEALYSIPVIELKEKAQKYIGDKVRQAEQLRAWAKRSEKRALELFNKQVDWSFEVLKVGKINKVLVSELNGRLDLKYNSPARLALLRHIKNKKITTTELVRLVNISAMIGWKGLTTEYYTDFGPWLLRGVEFRDGVIEFEKLVSVDRDKYLEQPQIHLKEGDIAFSKDGTIGKAIVIPELANDMAAGSTIARLRLKKVNEINPYYLELVLNHDFVQVQVESFATGIAQPHITQEWIAQLIIPRIKYEQVIGEYLSIHHLANYNSKILIQAAKTLVESLIEGQLTEQQLIQAQQALEDGDNSLDQAILSKLSAEGYAIEGATPLFSDVDELYSLLEEAAQAEAEE